MKKLMLSSLLAILTLAASAQTNTYAMVIEMQNGTKLTIGPNEVKNVTFNNGQLTVTGETIETLVGSAVDQAKAYTDQAAANLKGYIDLAVALEQVKGSLSTLAATVDGNKSEAASSLKAAVEGLQAQLAAAKTLVENNDAAIRALIDTKTGELVSLTNGNTSAISKNAQDIIANGKNTEALQKFIPELEASLEKYADKVAATAAQAGKDAASNAQAMAQNYALDQIKMQATMDKEAWSKAIDISIESLVKTYQLNAMKEIISSEINAAIVNLIQTYNLQKQ